MKATQLIHHLGQSIWLDNITRGLLDNGMLIRDKLIDHKTYIDKHGEDLPEVRNWRRQAK